MFGTLSAADKVEGATGSGWVGEEVADGEGISLDCVDQAMS